MVQLRTDGADRDFDSHMAHKAATTLHGDHVFVFIEAPVDIRSQILLNDVARKSPQQTCQCLLNPCLVSTTSIVHGTRLISIYSLAKRDIVIALYDIFDLKGLELRQSFLWRAT
jgi:hypothetical protein